MTTGIKISIGCGSVMAIGAVVLVIAFIAFVYLVESNPAYKKAEAEGAAFGKNVNQTSCMTEGFKRSKNIGILDITDSAVNGTFVEACLKSSSHVVGFCEGVPGIISSDSDWHQAECTKAGQDATGSGCLGVSKAKQRFCD